MMISQSNSLNASSSYEIIVSGHLDAGWLAWLEGFGMHTDTLPDGCQVTILTQIVMDQAGLVGLIRRLHGLGIVLLSIRRESMVQKL